MKEELDERPLKCGGCGRIQLKARNVIDVIYTI